MIRYKTPKIFIKQNTDTPIYNTLITKYGINYQDYDKTLLSTKVGIIELDKINSYINNKSLK